MHDMIVKMFQCIDCDFIEYVKVPEGVEKIDCDECRGIMISISPLAHALQDKTTRLEKVGDRK